MIICIMIIFGYYISKLPIPQTKDYLDKILNLIQTDCAICMDKITTNDYIYDFKCSHKYHYNCMDQYLDIAKYNAKCPICRESIMALIK